MGGSRAGGQALRMITSSTGQLPQASSVRQQLVVLEAERATAHLAGLDSQPEYMEDLNAEIDAYRTAYLGIAVTEIATLRGELSGRLQG
jgi:hypothetical protein